MERLTYVTWSDVAQGHLEFDDLRTLATSMRAETLLSLISLISVILTNTHWDRQRFQQRTIARQICPPDTARRVDGFLARGERDVLAHTDQLLLAAKLAILYGQPGPAERELQPTAVYQMGKLLLGINEVLEQREVKLPFPDEFMINLVLRTKARARNEQLPYLLARYFDLLVTRSRRKEGIQHDLDALFQEQIGLSIEEYMALAFWYYTPFINVTGIKLDEEPGFLDRVKQREQQMHSPELVKRCRALFTNNVASFRKSLKLEDDAQLDLQTILDASLRPFKQQPLFQLENGSALPIHLPFLQEKVAMGAYWILLDSFIQRDPDQGARTFIAYVGELFQDYLTTLLARTYTNSRRPNQQFFSEQQILDASPPTLRKKGKKADRPCDGLIVSGHSLIVVEMFGGALPITVMEKGQRAGFEDIFRRSFHQKISQLKAAFEGFATGIWRVPGLDLAQITHVYPVLALLHPFPEEEVTLRPLRDLALPRYRFINGTKILIHETQMMNAEDFEILEPLLHDGTWSISDLLERKLSRPETVTTAMKNFLLLTLGLKERVNEQMLALYDAASDEIRSLLIRDIDFPPE